MMMAANKSRLIPEWQRSKPTQSKDGTQDTAVTTDSTERERQQSSRASILEQAAKFLEADEVRDRSTDRKISFLESKGLTKEETHQLLGLSDSRASTSIAEKPPSTSVPLPTQSQSSPPPTASNQSHDIPPIITYPEFLLHSQKPPPLITARRLLNTLYLASGTVAAIYGTSQYLVSPMIESLTSARHSLFETTSSNLDTLHVKLEEAVSVVPPLIKNIQLNTGSAEGDDVSSIISDPAELFHRDTGTQTSIPPSPSSLSFTSMPSPPTTILSSQSQKLRNLHSHLSEFLSSSEELQISDKSIQDELHDFQKYLDGVSYGRIHDQRDSIGKTNEKDDEIAKIKAEIRGVKGVLLSSKTFPPGLPRSRVGA